MKRWKVNKGPWKGRIGAEVAIDLPRRWVTIEIDGNRLLFDLLEVEEVVA